MSCLCFAHFAHGDSITLKNGGTYQGSIDREGTVLTVFDGVRRVIVRDSKVAKRDDSVPARLEAFRIEQPLTVPGGVMPEQLIRVKAGPWNEKGQRTFEFVGSGSGRAVTMTQAINEIGPQVCQIRGVDGYWKAQLATSQIPREVILGLLARVDRQDQGARLQIGRFLIQAEWYDEALIELDGIERDFPDLVSTVGRVRQSVQALRAQAQLGEALVRRDAQEPQRARSLLNAVSLDGASEAVRTQVREERERLDSQAEADRALERQAAAAVAAVPVEQLGALRDATRAMLRDLAEAPDAMRNRFAELTQPVDAEPLAPEVNLARFLTTWMAGDENRSNDLAMAEMYWEARSRLQDYLASRDEAARSIALEQLRSIRFPDDTIRGVDPGLLTAIARMGPPALRDASEERAEVPRRFRPRDDVNPEPTEYVVLLPPEYRVQRSYPLLVILHSGDGPEAAIEQWKTEAARRGVILIAPEYNLRDQPRDYRYSQSEHASVELSIRDAQRRFSVDSNRVYLAGSLLGGQMAWDFGLAHPDMLAGVIVLGGLPAKYVSAYRPNAKLVPFYIVMGELTPLEADYILPLGTGFVARNYDAIFIEYYKRGLESFLEEIPDALAWVLERRREPYPKEFEVVSARPSDARFFGVVVREYASDRVKLPEAVDPLGKNLKPATIARRDRTLANLLDIDTSGVERMDIWLGPPNLDPRSRLEIRANGRSLYKGQPAIELNNFLEDLRIRGDRQQVYWLKYSTAGRGTGGTR